MKRIKKSALSRGLSLAKISLKTSTKAAGQYLSGQSQEDEDYIVSQIKSIAEELGLLKGSFMKIGQAISMYGEHFLPPKANAFLKELQFESPAMDWEAIEATIEKDLGLSAFNDLDIETKALASASLGQVHKATHKKTGEVYAMKVQYPGVDQAIDSDVKNLKRVFSIAKIFPSDLKLDLIFEEVRSMLHQETHYKIEKDWTQKIYNLFKDQPNYIIPKVIEKYSTDKILTTQYEPGFKVDSEEVKKLPQDSKNKIGFLFLDYYINELFNFKAVQTDPHLGNYRIRMEEDEEPKLVLYDFGAVREVPSDFSENFKGLIKSALEKNEDKIIKYGMALGYLRPEDSKALKDSYINLCYLILEPFQDTDYSWPETDLPKRVAKAGTEIAKNFKLRTPPTEAVFLDRKLGGTFIFLSVIGFKANTHGWLKDKLD